MSKENKYIRSLVQSAQEGNNAILKQLFEMNLKRIHSLSLRLMGNPQLAEELTVSVFLSASKRIKSYKPDILFSDWLILNTIHDALEQMKNEGKKKKKKRVLRKKSVTCESILSTWKFVTWKTPKELQLF